MRIRLLLMAAISMLFAGITAAPAGAQCLAVDAYVIVNGNQTYLIPNHTCVLNTAFTATHIGPFVGTTQFGVGADVWIPAP